MKIELTIYLIVIILSLSTPITMYLLSNNNYFEQASIHKEISKELELRAMKLESGEEKVHIENNPDALRYQAQAEMDLADYFTNQGLATKHFFKASLWATFAQITFLVGLIIYRKDHIRNND
jgi:hypothetical protein